MTNELANVELQGISEAEGREIFDATAQRLLGMPGDDFIAAWDRGEFQGDDRLAVMKLAVMLPFGRE